MIPAGLSLLFQYWLSTGIEAFMMPAGLSLNISTGSVLESRFS